jgi:hypothetical protein
VASQRTADIRSLRAAHFRFTKPVSSYSDATLHRRANQVRRGAVPRQQRTLRGQRGRVALRSPRAGMWHEREYVTYRPLLRFLIAHMDDLDYRGLIQTLQKDTYDQAESWVTNSEYAQFGYLVATHPTVESLRNIHGPILIFAIRYRID